MNLQYEEGFNSSSTGKVKNLLAVAAVAATTFSLGTNAPSVPEHFQVFHEKVIVNYTESTGSNEIFPKDFGSYYTLQSFAKKFLLDIVDVPPEFDKLFKENFWDILA